MSGLDSVWRLVRADPRFDHVGSPTVMALMIPLMLVSRITGVITPPNV